MNVLIFVLDNLFFFFKQKTAYEMRISDWSSDVCSSDLKEVRWYCAVSALAILTLPGAAIARGADEPAGAAAALSGEPQDAAPQATQTDIATAEERKSVGEGKRVSVRVDLGGGRTLKKKNNI